jgi:hypothetical protein
MVSQLCAYGIVLWLCPVGPLVLIGLGVQIGRHGARTVLTRALVRVFGNAPEGEEQKV